MKKFIASFLSLFFVLNSVSVTAFALDNPKLDVLYECSSWNQAVSTGNVVFNNCKVDNKQIKLPSVDLSDNLNNYSKNSVGFQFQDAAIKKITIKFHSRSSCSVLNEGNKLVLESMGNPFLNEDLIAVRNNGKIYALNKSESNNNDKYIFSETKGRWGKSTYEFKKTDNVPSQYDYYGLNVIGNNNLDLLAKLKSSDAIVKTDSHSTNFFEYTNTYELDTPVSQATMYFDLSPVCKNSTAIIESIKIEGIKNKEKPKEDENKDNGKVDKEETEKPIDKPTDKPASPEESKKPSTDDKKPKPVEPDKPSKNDPAVKPQKPNNKEDGHFPSVSFGDSIINRDNMEVKSNNNDSDSSTNVSKVVTSIIDIKTKEISSDKTKDDKTKDQNIQKKVIAKNAETISLKAIEEAKEKNIKIYADTATGYKVKARVYIPTDKEISSDINVLFNEKATKKSKYVFESFFDNDVECIKFGEDGNEDLKLRTATKLDLSNLNTDELYFYAYSLETNSYYKFSDSTSFIDKNGYIHLTMPMDRVAIITDKPLKLK